MKSAYLILGAVGSGKTVLADFLLSSLLKNTEYVGADILKEKYFSSSKKAYRCADEFLFYRIEQICKSGRDFVYEFCPTNPNKIETTKYLLRKYDYQTVSLFVGTDDVQVNLERCAAREARGADPVNRKKVESRYVQSLSRVLEMIELSNRMYFVDISAETPKLIALLARDELAVLDSSCSWFKQHVQKKLLLKGGERL